MYVTQKAVRLQKNEIDPVVDFILRGLIFLNTKSKLNMFVRLFLTFVVRRKTMVGAEWRSALSWTKEIGHHEIRQPRLKNAKGLYFRKMYVQRDPDACREWYGLIDQAVDKAILFSWGGSTEQFYAAMKNIRDRGGVNALEYEEIVNYMASIGYDIDVIPAWGECEIISMPYLESA